MSVRPAGVVVLLGLVAWPGVALGQPAITIEVEDSVLRPGESTVVRLWAGFGFPDYAMAGIDTDLVTSVGSEGWSGAMLETPMAGPGTTAGVASATGYDGIVAGQLNFPGGAGIFADPSNPIAFWNATYTAPADVATPFVIDLSTMTRRYDVFICRDCATSASRLADLAEGAGTIRVVPAPASGLVLACGLLVMRRRR